MKYEITDENKSNLMVFLDRVEIKGLKEIQAITQIINCLNIPIKEGKSEEIK